MKSFALGVVVGAGAMVMALVLLLWGAEVRGAK